MNLRISKDYNERRIEFLETTKKLVFTLGYKKMSVQMLTEKVGVAKGTFYHYFKSKEDLLSQWVMFEVEKALPEQETIANDPGLEALEKLNKIFAYGRDWKIDHIDFILSAAEMMYHDNNIELRQLMVKQSSAMMSKLLKIIINQGVQEGTFNTPYPEKIAEILPELLQPFTEKLNRVLIGEFQDQEDNIAFAMEVIEVLHDTIERILGAPKGSLVMVDKAFMATFIEMAIFRHKSSPEKSNKVLLNENI